MMPIKLVFRNLFFFKSLNLLLFASIVVAVAVFSGALIIGDSVNFNLERITSERLGNTVFAAKNDDYFFTDTLAEGMKKKLDTGVSSMIELHGNMSFKGMTFGDIDVYGYDGYFFKNGLSTQTGDEEIFINKKLASIAGIMSGDEVTLSIERRTLIAKGTPFSKVMGNSVKRYKVKVISGAIQRENFSLKKSNVLPENIFISKQILEKQLGLYDVANLILIDNREKMKKEDVYDAMKSSFKTDDAGFVIFEKKTGENILKNNRIFINGKLLEILDKAGMTYAPVFTYFSNSISNKDKTSNYFFISGVKNYKGGINLMENEIILGDEIAREINAKPNSEVKIEYFTFDQSFKYKILTSVFTVKAVRNVSFFEQDLTPNFSGFTESENCSDWAPSIPIDLKRISKKNEEYWAKYKATPKAIISYDTAKKLWKNGYGNLTSVRFDGKTHSADEIEKTVREDIKPEDYGITLSDLRSTSGVTDSTVELAGLLLSLSFFVIAACLLFAVILVFFSIESRKSNIMVLRHLGLSKKMVYMIYMTEWVMLALCGSLIGSFMGILIASGMLSFFFTVSIDMAGTAAIVMKISMKSLMESSILGFVLALVTVAMALAFILPKCIISDSDKTGKEIIYTPQP